MRSGLAALLLLQLVGLNAWAWQQRQALAAARLAQEQLLRSTFPQVRAVLDAPLQMQRETEALRAAAGRAGDDDLEALLGAAAVGLARRPGPGADAALRARPADADGAGLERAAAGAVPRAAARRAAGPSNSSEGRVTLSRAARRGARS